MIDYDANPHLPRPQPGEPDALQAIIDVSTYYKHELSPFESDLWQSVVQRYGHTLVVKFLQAHVMRSKFRPQIADFESTMNPGASNAGAAFLEMTQQVRLCGPYESPNFTDQALVLAVTQLGGWVAVNQQLPSPDQRFDYEAFQKRFETAYSVAAARLAITPDAVPRLQGIHESGNTDRAQLLLAGGNPFSASATRSVIERARGG